MNVRVSWAKVGFWNNSWKSCIPFHRICVPGPRASLIDALIDQKLVENTNATFLHGNDQEPIGLSPRTTLGPVQIVMNYGCTAVLSVGAESQRPEGLWD